MVAVRGPLLLTTIVATISIVCVAMLGVLIARSRQNGFLLIIRALAFSTMIYCCSFLLMLYRGDADPFLFVAIFGDTLMAGWAFILSINLFRIVAFLNSANIHEEMKYYHLVNYSIASIFVISLGINAGKDAGKSSPVFRAFYWYRLVIVSVNLLIYNICVVLLGRLSIRVQRKELTQYQADGIKYIVRRLRLYSLAQIFVRLGATIYDFNNQTLDNDGLHYFDALTGPSSGILYFLIFVTMQPDGLALFKSSFLFWLPPSMYDAIVWPQCCISSSTKRLLEKKAAIGDKSEKDWESSEFRRSRNSNMHDLDRESDYMVDIDEFTVVTNVLQQSDSRPTSTNISNTGIRLSTLRSPFDADKTSLESSSDNTVDHTPASTIAATAIEEAGDDSEANSGINNLEDGPATS